MYNDPITWHVLSSWPTSASPHPVKTEHIHNIGINWILSDIFHTKIQSSSTHDINGILLRTTITSSSQIYIKNRLSLQAKPMLNTKQNMKQIMHVSHCLNYNTNITEIQRKVRFCTEAGCVYVLHAAETHKAVFSMVWAHPATWWKAGQGGVQTVHVEQQWAIITLYEGGLLTAPVQKRTTTYSTYKYCKPSTFSTTKTGFLVHFMHKIFRQTQS